MSNTAKTKQKKTSALGSKKNVKKMLSLTERLRETRTKESDRKCETTEKTKKRSKHMIRNYSSKEITENPVESGSRGESRKSAKRSKTSNCSSVNKADRKGQSFQSTYFQPYSKEISQGGETSEENGEEGTNKMIFVSLDFIEDCQKYKKKFMKPMCGQELKSMRKSLRNISSYHKRYLGDQEQSPKSQKGNRQGCKETTMRCKDQAEGKRRESFAEGEAKVGKLEKGGEACKEGTEGERKEVKGSGGGGNDEISTEWDELTTETFSIRDSFNVKPSSEDVSTVDKKYIELLLSIANCNETKEKTQMRHQEPKETERDFGFRPIEKRIISGKTFFENKIKKEKAEKERQLKESEKGVSGREVKPEESNGVPMASPENTVFARLVRDLTKSEVQIHQKKRKNPQRHSEIQSEKKTAHSKPEVNDNRKKRKTRNNVLTNNNEEVVEMSFPSEVSKVADVKELWRREIRRKSENSLSSQSSSTVPEKEDIPRSKNLGLESYKLLRRIVEEEVKTICKKFVEEKAEDKGANVIENEHRAECDEESKKLKNVCKELRSIMSENTKDLFETNGGKVDEVVKKRTVQSDEHKFRENCEGKKKKDDLLKYLDKYESEDLSGELSQEKKKLPSEMVKNWSILHRLEKAFLALGTPTFPNHKVKDPSTLKITGTNDLNKVGEDSVKLQEESLRQKRKKLQNLLEKKEKKNQITGVSINSKYKSDASETCNSKPSSQSKTLESSRNKSAESKSKQPLQKEKSHVGKPSGNGSLHSAGAPASNQKTAEGEDKSKQKKVKCQSQKPNIADAKKSPPRSLAKPKVCEFESRYLKRDAKQKKCKHNAAAKSSAKAKSNEPKERESGKQKPSKTLLSNLNQNEEENLERKKTFDVIPVKVSSKITARKSKSCNKIDDSLDSDSAKKRFPPTRTIDCKNLEFLNFSEVKANADSTIENEIMSNIKPTIVHKGSAKKKTPQVQERPKTVSEKEYLRGNRESVMKPVKERVSHEKKSEKAVPLEDVSRQMLPGKEIPKGKNRAVKERSILSIRGNQHGNRPQRKGFLHLQGKPVCNFSVEPDPSKVGKELLEKDVPKDLDVLLGMCEGAAEENLSFSCASTCTFDVADSTLQGTSSECHPKAAVSMSPQNRKGSAVSEELSSLSSASVSTLGQQQNVEEERRKCSKSQQIWEHDIKQYRAIVREIMSQYKRIDGFLKQNEHSQSFPRASVSLMSKEDEANNELSKISKNLQEMNINEYRQKILSEYQALPIFEYKTKIQQEAGNAKTEEKRRNLSFVKALKTEMDVDVKDFQPNIQKILDSQLYVDTENLFKRNEPYVKFNEKKSSLQEIVLSKNEKTIKEEECLRCISTPKTFPSLPRAPVHSTSTQNIPTTGVTADDSAGLETFLLKI